jgi:hypothetical protein
MTLQLKYFLKSRRVRNPKVAILASCYFKLNTAVSLHNAPSHTEPGSDDVCFSLVA